MTCYFPIVGRVAARVVVALAACSIGSLPVQAVEILTVAPGQPYTARDVLTNSTFGSFDLSVSQPNRVAGWANGKLEILDLAGGPVKQLGSPGGYSGWNSFTTWDPSGNSIWVGFTYSLNVDDRIYQVDINSGEWTQKATLPANYDLRFYNGAAFVSALNVTNYQGGPNKLWRLDTSGANQHDLIADVGGLAGGLAFDPAGNLYYGTSGLDSALVEDAKLIRYTKSQVDGAVGSNSLTRLEAETLYDLTALNAGLSGVHTVTGGLTCDAVGHLLLNTNAYDSSYNSYHSSVWLWDDVAHEFSQLAIATGNSGLSFLKTEGDITSNGSFYQLDYWHDGLAQVSHGAASPEPSTVILLITGGLAVLAWRWRRGR